MTTMSDLAENYGEDVRVVQLDVSATERISTGEYEHLQHHAKATLEVDMSLDDIDEVLLEAERRLQQRVEQACDNKHKISDDEDWEA